MTRFSLSYGGIEHLDLLTDHRLQMWKEIHPDMVEQIENSRQSTKKWIQSKLHNGSMVAMIVEEWNGSVAGSGCILIKEDQPRPGSNMLNFPYLLSMYTLPDYRNMGVATIIVKEAIKWSREKGYDRISLHASRYGRALYERFGFEQTNEMRLKLK